MRIIARIYIENGTKEQRDIIEKDLEELKKKIPKIEIEVSGITRPE